MTTTTLFQITSDMVKASTTLAKKDIGLWCFIYKGRYHGFASSKYRASLIRQALLE